MSTKSESIEAIEPSARDIHKNKLALALLSAEQRSILSSLVAGSDLSDAMKLTLERAIAAPFHPKVALGVEGDWPQGASANWPIDLAVIDHDRDETDGDHARLINVDVDAGDCASLMARIRDDDDGEQEALVSQGVERPRLSA